MKSNSVFLSNLHYFYAQTDGTYAIPNSAEGDLLKTAKKEIEAYEKENAELREDKERLEKDRDEWKKKHWKAHDDFQRLFSEHNLDFRTAIDAAKKEPQP